MASPINAIEAIDVALSGEPSASSWMLSAERPNVIRAYRVTIKGLCRAPGQDVDIYASEVVAESGALIYTNGRDGSPTYQPNEMASKGLQPGDPGKDGIAGGNGSKGGAVIIVCSKFSGNLLISTRGGVGGRGQDGGQGQTGAHGKDGTENLFDSRIQASGQVGGRGGTGGAPGAAGVSSDGGNITVRVVDPLPPNAIATDVAGGQAVPAANPGKGGDPGSGGIPTRYGTTYTSGRDQEYQTKNIQWTGTGDRGNPGPRGDDHAPVLGTPAAKDGQTLIQQIRPEDLAQVQSTSLMRQLLTYGERLYLNEKYEDAIPILQFVSFLSKVRATVQR